MNSKNLLKKVSGKVLSRSKGRTFLLLFLIMLITVFSVLGVSLLVNSRNLLKQADETFQTLALVEYTGGNYPIETAVSSEDIEHLKDIDSKLLEQQEEVLDVHKLKIVRAYHEGALFQGSLRDAYFENAVITFEITGKVWTGGYLARVVNPMFSTLRDSSAFFEISPAIGEEYGIKEGRRYIANGTMYVMSNSNYGFIPTMDAVSDGEDSPIYKIEGYPLVDITDYKKDLSDYPAYKYWEELSECYHISAGSVAIGMVDSLETFSDFYLGLSELKEGRTWTEEERQNQVPVIVLNNRLAGALNCGVGDEIPLKLHYSENPANYYNSYVPEKGFKSEKTFRVIGIYEDNAESTGAWGYIPDTLLDMGQEEQYHYYIAGIELENGKSSLYLHKVEDEMPTGVRISVYDQGYEQTVAPIYIMQFHSVIILVLCSVCAITVLMLFGILYINKQQVTVAVLVALGTGKTNIRAYLQQGTIIIAGWGALAGTLIGYIGGKPVTMLAYYLAKHSQTVDLRFSSMSLGMQKNFTPEIRMNLAAAIGVGAAIFVLTVIISRVLGNRLISKASNFGGQTQKKSRKKTEVTVDAAAMPKASFQYRKISSGTSKKSIVKRASFVCLYGIKGLVRNRRVNLILTMVPLVITVFMVIFTQTIQNQKDSLEEAYDKFPVSAYFTTCSGRFISTNLIPGNILHTMENSSNVAAVNKEQEAPYEYVDAVGMSSGDADYNQRIEDLIAKGYEQMKMPEGYGLEHRVFVVWSGERLTLASDINKSFNYFFGIKPTVTYLEGYEDAFVNQKEQPVLVDNAYMRMNGVVTSMFLEEHQVSLGDEVVIFYSTFNDSGEMYHSFPVVLKIIGCYSSKSDNQQIFVPWNGEVIKQVQALWNSENFLSNVMIIASERGVSMQEAMELIYSPPAMTTLDTIEGEPVALDFCNWFNFVRLEVPERLLPYLKEYDPEGDLLKAKFINYDLTNTRNLAPLKDELVEAGVTNIGELQGARVSIVFTDRELVQAVQTYKNSISFMTTLGYVLFGVAFIIGFTSAYLAMRGRKEEIAMIRSMGTGKIRTFFMLFSEQLAVSFVGILLGLAGMWLYLGAMNTEQLFMVGLFFICYTIGSGISLARMNKKNVLKILSAAD